MESASPSQYHTAVMQLWRERHLDWARSIGSPSSATDYAFAVAQHRLGLRKNLPAKTAYIGNSDDAGNRKTIRRQIDAITLEVLHGEQSAPTPPLHAYHVVELTAEDGELIGYAVCVETTVHVGPRTTRADFKVMPDVYGSRDEANAMIVRGLTS